MARNDLFLASRQLGLERTQTLGQLHTLARRCGEVGLGLLTARHERIAQCDWDGETVICFIFNELEKFKSWWLVVEDDKVDLCTENPGKEVDVYINASVRSMVEIWQGNLDIRKALRDQVITVIGNKAVRLSLPDWLGICLYAHIKPAV